MGSSIKHHKGLAIIKAKVHHIVEGFDGRHSGAVEEPLVD